MEILIGLRFPNGKKIQKSFSSNTKLQQVLNFALTEMAKDTSTDQIDFDTYTLLQMPNIILNDVDQTLKNSNIKNRSMLFVINKK